MQPSELKVSVNIPYYRRIDNLRLVLSALARQSTPRDEFEVVIGAMEYSTEYVELCREFEDRVQIVSVLCSDPWQIAKGRNMALRQSRGEVVVFLDADILLPYNFIRDVYSYFSWGQKQCILGQMVDYENNTRDVDHVDVAPFDSYIPRLTELEENGPGKIDMRFDEPHTIPWAYAWTALIMLPRSEAEKHGLYFNESYRGYGVEDLEWASRIMDAGLPIRMEQSIWGIHLPHPRSLAANHATEAKNYRRFLTARPHKAVELACAFGDYEANKLFPSLMSRMNEVLPANASKLGSALLRGAQGDVLALGLSFDEHGRPLDLGSDLAGAEVVSCSDLIGLNLPRDDKSVAKVVVLPKIAELGDPFAAQVAKEASRLSEVVEHV